jgi:hypothetical protein
MTLAREATQHDAAIVDDALVARRSLNGSEPASLPADVAAGRPAPVVGMLVLRPVLAVVFQAILAALFLGSGSSDAWRDAADWWLATFALVSVVNLVVLRWLLHREGGRLRDLYRPSADRIADLKWAGLALLVAGPAAFVPNLALGAVLWGSSQTGSDLSFRSLPVLAAAALVLAFPVVHAMAELPTYFGYVMPRLAILIGSRWQALLIAAAVLSLQHVALPLLFDWRYAVWRALMFLPFALWIGFVVMQRPTTMPYLVVGHALLDASLPILVLLASLE